MVKKENLNNTYNPYQNITQTVDGGYVFQTIEYKWTRDTVPGVIGSKISDTTYNVTIYPNGQLVTMNPQASNPQVEALSVVVTQLQIATGETIPPGTSAMVSKIAEFRIMTTELYNAQARTLTKSVNVQELQAAYYMQVPVWL